MRGVKTPYKFTILRQSVSFNLNTQLFKILLSSSLIDERRRATHSCYTSPTHRRSTTGILIGGKRNRYFNPHTCSILLQESRMNEAQVLSKHNISQRVGNATRRSCMARQQQYSQDQARIARKVVFEDYAQVLAMYSTTTSPEHETGEPLKKISEGIHAKPHD